jgi:hypothetical protein
MAECDLHSTALRREDFLPAATVIQQSGMEERTAIRQLDHRLVCSAQGLIRFCTRK